MVTLSELRQDISNLKLDYETAIGNARINPRQVATQRGLSDIDVNLGVVRAGEFLAMSSGTDPQASDGIGTFISALGRIFNSKTYHIGGVENGDLKWGANSLTGELEAGDGTAMLTENGLSIYDAHGIEIARLGNLNGFLSYSSDTQGIGIGSASQYMTYDQTNGLKVYGALTTDREILSADRTYYVSSSGSDSNSGLTAALPFLTIQHAIDTAANLDTRDYNITIQLATGSYTVSPIICKDLLGSGTVTIVGSTVDLLAVTLTGAGDVFTASHLTTNYIISGMRIISGGYGIHATHNSHIQINNVNFGACTTAQLAATKKATIEITDDYTISDDSTYHFYATEFGYIVYEGAGITVTLDSTPDFTTFAYAEYLAALYMPNITWTGTATGQKFYAAMNSIMYVNDTTVGGVDYFPGDAAGATATGGQYA